MNEYLIDTIASVFPHVYTVRVSGGSNMELFASADAEALARFESRYPQLEDEATAHHAARGRGSRPRRRRGLHPH